MANKSVSDWLGKYYPDYCGKVTVDLGEKEVERKMIGAYGDFGIKMPPYSYKRYGYGLSHLVAQNFAYRTGALELDFSARLTNCGMAAISTVLEIILRGTNLTFFTSPVLYPETSKAISSTKVYGANFFSGDDQVLKGLDNQLGMVFLEPIGNGMGMPVFDIEEAMRSLWKEPTFLVIDNTLLTCCLLNPFKIYAKLQKELGSPKMQLIYVESLSKHYRVNGQNLVTAGIIVSSNDFIEKVDEVIMRNGAYLQFPCLEKLPFDLFTACKRVMPWLCRNAKAAAEFLEKQQRVEEVFYPDLPGGAGGVLYFVLEEDEVENVLPHMAREFGLYRGSFGHPRTSWVPFGKLVEGNPKGLVRLAVGYGEDHQEIISKLKNVLS